jgi:hypothetical protein
MTAPATFAACGGTPILRGTFDAICSTIQPMARPAAILTIFSIAALSPPFSGAFLRRSVPSRAAVTVSLLAAGLLGVWVKATRANVARPFSAHFTPPSATEGPVQPLVRRTAIFVADPEGSRGMLRRPVKAAIGHRSQCVAPGRSEGQISALIERQLAVARRTGQRCRCLGRSACAASGIA